MGRCGVASFVSVRRLLAARGGCGLGEGLAGFEIELARGKHGDFRHEDDLFGAPEGWHALIQELVAQMNAFLFEGRSDNGG